jgi:hypothetical protein
MPNQADQAGRRVLGAHVLDLVRETSQAPSRR